MKIRSYRIAAATAVCAAALPGMFFAPSAEREKSLFSSSALLTATAEAEASSLWTTVDGVTKQSSDAYGTVFASDGAFRLISSKKVWADKFGLAFRMKRDSKDGITIAVASGAAGWYTEQAGPSFSMTFVPEDDALTVSRVTVSVNGEAVKSFSSNMINWTDAYSYSTNYVYFGKSDDGWFVNLNDSVISLSEEESAKTESAFAGFTDGIGYLQVENLSGGLTFTYVGVQYGIPDESTDLPELFGPGVLNSPRWTVTSGDELAGWQADYGKTYTVQGNESLPLNGFELDMRMAHGEKSTAFTLAFTSLYQHNWYAGTYSVCFRIQWYPEYDDNSAMIQLMIYTPKTELLNEEPIKITETVKNFLWFKTNKIEIRKSRGLWSIYLNGGTLFSNKTSAEGKSVFDYLSEIAPYYTGGAGYLQFFAEAGSDGTVSGDAFVVEAQKTLKRNKLPSVDKNVSAQITSASYSVGEQISIDLSELFTDADGDSLHYFATKGSIEGSVWTYTASAEETLYVTFTGSDAVGGESVRLVLGFVYAENVGTDEGGCNSAIGFLPAFSAAAAAFVIFAAGKRR